MKKWLEDNSEVLSSAVSFLTITGIIGGAIMVGVKFIWDDLEWPMNNNTITASLNVEHPNDKKAESEIDQLLRTAYRRLESNKLTTPHEDSAFYYFNRALEIEPRNSEATKGILIINAKYISLIRSALEKNEIDNANTYINRLSNISPDNAGLTEMKKVLAIKVEEEERKQLIQSNSGKSDTVNKSTSTSWYPPKSKRSINESLKKITGTKHPSLSELTGSWVHAFDKAISGPLGDFIYGSSSYQMTITPDNHISVSNNWIKGIKDCPFDYKNGVLNARCKDSEMVIKLTFIVHDLSYEVLYKDKSYVFWRNNSSRFWFN